MSTRCHYCDAEVIRATTEKGKSITLSAQPVDGGNIRLEERSYPVYGRGPLSREEIVLTAVHLDASDVVPRYVAHFEICKDAKEWRKS